MTRLWHSIDASMLRSLPNAAKGTLAVEHHSTLVLNIREGEIDFISNYNQTVAARPGGHRLGAPARDSLDVNTHWYHEQFSGRAKQFLEEVMAAMKGPKDFDHSDLQSDYHHCRPILRNPSPCFRMAR
jgi:hypothetical protein